ncbi:MAG: pentapeptide repeat-containing protein [Acidobacteria bacterium]|nr:pentapeptide repeat-containing protein [Acidobacteriota bacterium]
MKELDIINRWHNAIFVEEKQPVLQAMLRKKYIEGPADMGGLIIGLEGQLDEFSMADFQDAFVINTDLRQSRFSCAFSRCTFTSTCFADATFDTCRFPKAKFLHCDFTKAKLGSPWLDDAIFRSCTFKEAKLNGRGSREYGGKRCLFEECQFENSDFRNLQFRASQFLNCRFENVVFTKCTLIGVKFVGSAPSETSFVNCDLRITKE